NICGPEGLSVNISGDVFANTRLTPCAHSGVWKIADGSAPTATQATLPFSNWGEGSVFLACGTFRGHIIAADSTGGRIVRADPETFGDLVKSSPPSFIEGLCEPAGIAIGNNGHIFVADACRGEILEFDPEGKNKQTIFSGLLTPLFLE